MLKRLKIWIYENYFPLILSLTISFFFWQNLPSLSFLLGFLFSWYLWGHLGQGIFLGFIFLPLIYFFINSTNLSLNFWIPPFFLLLFFILKKFKNLEIFLFALIAVFVFFLSKNTLFYLFLPLSAFFLNLFFIKRDIFKSLVYSLIFFEIVFIFQFLPITFLKQLIFLPILVLLLKYDIIKNNELNTNRY